VKAVTKIPTRRSLVCRIYRRMEGSWFPLFAIVTAVVVMVANFPE
jgi:hypothetical protein